MIAIPKKGQIWINKGFEETYKGRFFHAVVRVISSSIENGVTLHSIADNKTGEFDCNDSNFTLPFHEFLARFRKKKKGDIERFLKERKVYRVLYGEPSRVKP